jgi:hypothetical protein
MPFGFAATLREQTAESYRHLKNYRDCTRDPDWRPWETRLETKVLDTEYIQKNRLESEGRLEVNSEFYRRLVSRAALQTSLVTTEQTRRQTQLENRLLGLGILRPETRLENTPGTALET